MGYYIVASSDAGVYSYDACLPDGASAKAGGRRRNPTDWTYYNIPVSTITDRGYTGHEHLDMFGLINMNGRMYDPVLGRFAGVDPIIQSPDNSLSYNGYAYCLNNPLKYSDPTGYSYYYDPWTQQDGKFHSIEELMWSSNPDQLNDIYYQNELNNFNRGGDNRNQSNPEKFITIWLPGFGTPILIPVNNKNILKKYRTNTINPKGDYDKFLRNKISTEMAIGMTSTSAKIISGMEFKYAERINGRWISAAEKNVTSKYISEVFEGLGKGFAIASFGFDLHTYFDSKGTPADQTRLICAGIATIFGTIPYAGMVISVGYTILDSQGMFDDFYNSFNQKK